MHNSVGYISATFTTALLAYTRVLPQKRQYVCLGSLALWNKKCKSVL